MLTLEWESEGLQTVGIVVIICASLKLLHLLGLIDFSEGKVVAPTLCGLGRSGSELDTDAAEVEEAYLIPKVKVLKYCMLDMEQPSTGQFVSVYRDI